MRKNQMNERIFKLALKAMDFQGAVDIDTELKLTNSGLEKFAESIVKKCMDVAKYHTPDTEECEYTWLIHDKIKEYFGVEE
jgi:hypothetical protein